eukprot:jgi/Botrbrau1/1982/Bobra.0052s0025.1
MSFEGIGYKLETIVFGATCQASDEQRSTSAVQHPKMENQNAVLKSTYRLAKPLHLGSSSTIALILYSALLIVRIAPSAVAQQTDPEKILSALETAASHNQPQSTRPGADIPDLFNIGGWAIFLSLQFFPARTTDTLPTDPRLSLSPDSNRYTMKICSKADVTDCMPYESVGLPSRFSGIYWTDGVGDPSLAASTGGLTYDAKSRVISADLEKGQVWGCDATNSTWTGSYWTTSGPALFGLILSLHLKYQVYFNEDISHGSIVPVIRVLGIPIMVPTFILDFPMEWVGQDSWKRTSRGLNTFNLNAGNYILRRIVKDDGSRAYWFTKGWLNAKGDTAVAVLV